MTDQPLASLYLRSAVANAAAIAERRQTCEAHAAARGWQIGEIFTDDGASAHREGRLGILALRESIRQGRTALVLADEPSRLFRCVDSADTFAAFCATHDARIAYVHEPADLTEQIRQMMAEYNAARPD